MRRALIIFAKSPEKGKVKTRLAKDIGEYQAVSWYSMLLKRTESVAQGLAAVKTVFWADNIPKHPPVFNSDEFKFDVQVGDDLGARMANAFKGHFRQGYDAVVIVGTDCWDLKSKIVEKAFRALKGSDVVMGPAKDGGYYMLGLNKFNQDIFNDIDWSTEKVAEQTLAKCEANQLSVKMLEKLSDVDNVYDLPME